MAGGFPLRKWAANEASLLQDIPVEHRGFRESLSWQPHESQGLLGLQWHPGIDSFFFSTKIAIRTEFTKRSVLSLMARLFDPLGWLAPCIVRAKILFQSTWLQAADWNSPLDAPAAETWRNLQSELHLLAEIRVSRPLYPESESSNIEFHGFADASERAYDAAMYTRMRTDNYVVKLILAKTRVAPLKQITLLRLELCAATLLVRIAVHVRQVLNATNDPIHLWSDSTVALGWIRGHPTRWKTFVANRVSEIQTTLPEVLWHHLPGAFNPADCASRGISPKSHLAFSLVAGTSVAFAGQSAVGDIRQRCLQ